MFVKLISKENQNRKSENVVAKKLHKWQCNQRLKIKEWKKHVKEFYLVKQKGGERDGGWIGISYLTFQL